MSILKTNKTIWFTCPYMICYTSEVYTENKQNYLIYLSLYDLLYIWGLYWKQTKLSDLPVLIWFVILLMSILKTNKTIWFTCPYMICYTSDVYTVNKQTIWFTCPYMICYTSDVYTENKQNYLIYLSLYDLLYIWCLYWKQTKLSDLPVLIWFVILLMSILKTNKTIWFTCPYMICYTSDVYTENKQNYLIYLSLYDLLYIWCLYWKQTKLSDLPVLIWFVIHLMSILKTNKTIWFTCPYMICYTSDVYTENKQNYLIYLSLYDLLYIWCLYCKQTNYLIYLSLYDLLYFWCLYWKQTKLSDLPVLIWFVIHLMSILKTNKTIWFTCPYMICYTSDVYTENKQNYLIYLSLYDLLYIWCLYWKQTKLSDLPVLIWFVILLMSILKTNKTIWFTCPYMICYTSDVYTENKQNYLIYLSLYDLLYIWCLYWKQTKLSDLPVLIWFVIHLMSILKTNKTIWFTCPYMICYTSDVYTVNKQNYLIYLSLYDLLYIWCLYCKQTKLSDLPVLIWFVIHLMSILKTNKTIWFTCPYMICYTSDVYTVNKQNYLIYLSLYDLLYIWCLYCKQTKLSDLPVLIWFVIHLMSILKTKLHYLIYLSLYDLLYLICYTSDVYTENKQNYLIYLSLYDLLYFWCLYWKQTKLSDLPVLIWFVIHLMSILKTNKTIWFTCPYMICYTSEVYTENKQNYLIYLSLYDLLYIWGLYWKQTKLSDLPVLIWFVILLMSILKTNKTIWFTCPYMICYTSDVYTENKQNYLIYLSLYDLLYFWCLYWKQTKLSDLPVLIWFVIHLRHILKTNKTIWFTCPYMICYTSDVYTENKQNYLIYLSLYDLLYIWCLYWKQTKLSDLPVLIWFVIHLMSILKTNKTIWFTCPYMICYTSDVYTENKQNYLIYLSFIWSCYTKLSDDLLYCKQTKLSDLPVLIWFVIHLMSIL